MATPQGRRVYPKNPPLRQQNPPTDSAEEANTEETISMEALAWNQRRTSRCSASDQPVSPPTATKPTSSSRPGSTGTSTAFSKGWGWSADDRFAIKLRARTQETIQWELKLCRRPEVAAIHRTIESFTAWVPIPMWNRGWQAYVLISFIKGRFQLLRGDPLFDYLVA